MRTVRLMLAAAELSRSSAEERSVRLATRMQEVEDRQRREGQPKSFELVRKLDKMMIAFIITLAEIM